jgi:hypothetical protein
MAKYTVASRFLGMWIIGTCALSVLSCHGTPNEAPAAGSGNTAPAPQAAPGLGTNPTTPLTQAAPPANAGSGAAIQFTNQANLPFVDPGAGQASDRFFGGTWGLNGGYLEQSLGAKSASLTFREYNGSAFGTQGGQAPSKYRTDISAWVYQPSDQYPNMVGAPLGIVGYAPYFIDETHYLLVVAKPTTMEVWAVDGFPPGITWPVTNLLFSTALPQPLAVGTPVTWSVQVDTSAHTASVSLNGTQMTNVQTPFISERGQHVALVSNGNYLHFQNFKVYGL